MEEISKKVKSVQKRLMFDQWLRYCGWALFATLLVAVLGMVIPKLWVVDADPQVWMWSWAGGAVAAGLVVGALLTYYRRCPELDAAVELDQRFGLKERVASALSLTEKERDSEFGQALIRDASRRVERIEVKEGFALKPRWQVALPMAPLLVLLALLFIENAAPKEVDAANKLSKEEVERIKNEAEKLRKNLEKKKKELAEKGLEKLDTTFEKVEKTINELQKEKNLDKQKAMIKLNDVAKDLAKKRSALGGIEELQKQFKRMKDLAPGPADKMMDALKKGNFQAAAKEIRAMQKKLQSGDLSEKDKEKLAEQLNQMQQAVNKMQQKQQQMADQLRQQIAEKKKQGDMAGAGQLQRQLDKLNAQQGQMQQMQQMANKMQKAAENLKQGNTQQATQDLQQIAQDLQQMQSEMDQLESIDDMMAQLDMASANMMGQEQEMGQFGMGQGQGEGEGEEGDGDGMGQGEGKGRRAESKTDVTPYDTKVRQNVQKGESVKTGVAFGPNAPGVSREELKAQIQNEFSQKAEPIDNQPLPKFQRNHAREYFDGFLK